MARPSGPIHAVGFGLKAQCIDSTLLSPGSSCGLDYNPVCGCNGVTYRNVCFSRNYGGVTTYTSGVCGAVDFVFTPNPVVDVLYLKAFINVPGYLRVQIIDRFGKIFYSNIYQGVLAGYVFELNLDINEVPYGYCFIYVETNDGYKVMPFIKFRA
jgi:hypothetical protein